MLAARAGGLIFVLPVKEVSQGCSLEAGANVPRVTNPDGIRMDHLVIACGCDLQL